MFFPRRVAEDLIRVGGRLDRTRHLVSYLLRGARIVLGRPSPSFGANRAMRCLDNDPEPSRTVPTSGNE